MADAIRCPQCGAAIIHAIHDTGRASFCRACGAELTFPAAVASLSAEHTAFDAENPYASTSTSPSSYGYSDPGVTVPRDGPSWERDGYTLHSYLSTAKSVLLAPEECFRQMRRTGRVLAPVLYLMLGSLIGGLIAGLLPLLFFGAAFIFALFDRTAGPNEILGLGIFVLLLPAAQVGVQAFISTVVGLLMSLLIHLILSLLGGVKYPLQTTLRGVCYPMGSAVLIQGVPLCGIPASVVLSMIYIAWGLTRLHELPWWKPVVSTLVIPLFCFVSYFMLIFTAILFG